MGRAARLPLVCFALAVSASAEVRTAALKVTVNLDTLARQGAVRTPARRKSVAKPARPPRARARSGFRPSIERPAGSVPDAAYTVYGGFPALLDNYRSAPPDTGGAVGPGHVVTMLNAGVQIQSRSGEVRPNYPVDLNRFWSGLGDFPDIFDPRVQYDADGDRWIAAAGVNPGDKNAALLIGVSETGDPGGNWNLFQIDEGSAGFWADYPVLGFNANWIVLSANIFRLPPSWGYDRTDVYVFRKSGLYAGGDGQYQTFSDDQGEFSIARDSGNQSPGTLYLLQAKVAPGPAIRLSTLTGPPGAERFTAGAGLVPMTETWAETSPLDADFAPQYASWAKVDTGDSRLQNCVLRQGAIWCAHTVFLPADKPDRAAVQWFQLDPGTLQILQSGRIEDPAAQTFYAFPSIAVNQGNDVLIGFSRFNKDGFPDAAFALRPASDPPGAMGLPTVYKRGEAPYIAVGYDQGSNRWGDFSTTVVDPADDLSFWTIQEYASTATDGYLGRWGTWWAQVVPPSAGLNCTYSAAASASSFDKSGGAATLTVSTEAGCPWMAAPDAGWIVVQSGSPGLGSGRVAFSVAPNPGSPALSGTITVAGQPIAITQSGR